MSEIAKSYRANVECLANNIVNIRNILDEEPNPDYFCKLGDMSKKAMKEMSPIHDYYMNLKYEFRRSYDRRKWIKENPDKSKDFYLLLRPIENAYSFLDLLSFGTDAFSTRSEGIRQKGITQDAAPFIVQFGKFWETNRKDADNRMAELRSLIRKLM